MDNIIDLCSDDDDGATAASTSLLRSDFKSHPECHHQTPTEQNHKDGQNGSETENKKEKMQRPRVESKRQQKAAA